MATADPKMEFSHKYLPVHVEIACPISVANDIQSLATVYDFSLGQWILECEKDILKTAEADRKHRPCELHQSSHDDSSSISGSVFCYDH